MIKDFIDVPEEDMSKLERAYYEYCTAKDNIAYLIDKHQDGSFVDTDKFKYYHDLEVDKFKSLENIKNEITIKYIPVEILEAEKYEWEADFEGKKLVIKEVVNDKA